MYVHKIGNVDSTESSVVRIVHISDTHMMHDHLLKSIPEGDILIHSGDFSAFSVKRCFGNKEQDRDAVIDEINSFFHKLSFKHKIFVAGNHEMSFSNRHKDYIEKNLTEVTYLHDKSIEVEGLNIYGTSWTAKRFSSYARGFSISRSDLGQHWDFIPSETDILITHMPPQGVMDLGAKDFAGIRNLFSSNNPCNICGGIHEMQEHWGCKALKKAVLKRIRPTLHLFGHVHEQNGVTAEDGITFSNAAMKLKPTANVFDFYR